MKTTRHRRPGIRWGRVVLLPILVVAIAVAFMAVIYINDQNNLKSIEDRVKQLQEELQEYLDGHQNQELVQTVIASADGLALRYEYDEALAVLKQNESIQTNAAIKEKIATYQAAMDALVPYTGKVQHLFFQNLVISPKIAFGKTSHSPAEYRNLNITVVEFKNIIQQMYDRGYLLVDFNDVYENVEGRFQQKVIKLPAGKIPFILSVDEMSYPDPKPIDGFARGMTIRDGIILSRVLTPEGIELIKDGDVVPIIEDFISQHPDFSYRGGRGVLGLTGHVGTLGYRLTNDSEIEDAINLANELKKRGWIFACSSFGDQVELYLYNPVASKIKTDLQAWNQVIKPIVGSSDIFVNPYGLILPSDSLDVIESLGYKKYFIIDRRGDLTYRSGLTYFPRYDINIQSMMNDKEYVEENFFDVESVLDPLR